MSQRRYDDLAARVMRVWPVNGIRKFLRDEMVLRCENGTYVRIAIADDGLEVGWMSHVDATIPLPLNEHISKETWPEDEAAKKALEELATRVTIGAILT